MPRARSLPHAAPIEVVEPRRSTVKALARKTANVLIARPRAALINVEYGLRMRKWNPGKTIYVPAEPRDAFGYNPNLPGNCSGWARRAAKRFGKTYTTKARDVVDAWELAHFNRSVEKKPAGFTQAELLDRIRGGKITPGTVLGTVFERTRYARPDRDYTHVVMYQGEKGGRHYFGDNFRGPRVFALEDLFNGKITGFKLVEIIEPQ